MHDEIRVYMQGDNRDPAVGEKLARRYARYDRGFVKGALRAAGVEGELPRLKADCVAMLKKILTEDQGVIRD